ncbi:DNA primase family protein [Saccharibacillus kuerlensis]|uniref:SF3 helicase domain-containing protein n=1 Tax=Saccharibacillus kuerlensis TaxID=459527 RepID=A0ABQ2KZ36_9BACL|nr:phage/plasmid primase, P4 family [Saccharibacillus kuerlensis]GGN95012.1 hypothetical protein GCM10010969_10300 [Saccharibacillus kuerlensis]
MDKTTAIHTNGLAELPDYLNRNQNRSKKVPAEDPALTILQSSCPAFAQDWSIQQQDGLPEERWYKWISLLIASGNPQAALAFSRASVKHDAGSERRISELIANPPKGCTRCTTFGCDVKQVGLCFPNNVRKNEKGQITNSPVKSLATPRKKAAPLPSVNLSTVGFILDRNSGRPTGLNPNAFARHVVEHRLKLVHTLGDRFYLYDDGVWNVLSDNQLRRKLRDILNGYVADFWRPITEEAYLKALQLQAETVERMDGRRNLLNLENGMLSLRNKRKEPERRPFKLYRHKPEFHSTIRIPIHYNPKAACPRFDQFLAQIYNNDQELIDLTAEMFGYCLTSGVEAQKAFVLYGQGANGKSILAGVLEQLVGKKNVTNLTLSDLDQAFARSELVDKSLLLSTENEVGSKGLNTQFFKSVVAGDSIRVEVKYGPGFSYQPFCKLVLALNNLPYSRDKSHGFTRRLIVLPFNRIFREEEQDPHLAAKLNKELPGILNFALRGLRRLQKNKFRFSNSRAARQALDDYRMDLDPIERFIEDNIEAGKPDDRIPNRDMAVRYQSWCTGANISNPMNNQRLLNAIENNLRGQNIAVNRYKSGGIRGLEGVRLKQLSQQTTDLRTGFTTITDIEDIE